MAYYGTVYHDQSAGQGEEPDGKGSLQRPGSEDRSDKPRRSEDDCWAELWPGDNDAPCRTVARLDTLRLNQRLARAYGLLMALNTDLALCDTQLSSLRREVWGLFPRGSKPLPRHLKIILGGYPEQMPQQTDCSIMHGWLEWLKREASSRPEVALLVEKVDQSQRFRDAALLRQRGLREVISFLSRPGLRALTILDLPPELLREILSHLCRSRHSLETIQRLRLTCRQLCHIADHFLQPTVTLSLGRESLAILEAIARHPRISKSVTSVIFRLSLYKELPATDITVFAQRCCKLLQDKLGEYSSEAGFLEEKGYSLDATEAIRKGMVSLFQTWRRLFSRRHVLDPNTLEGEEKNHFDFLIAQQAEYKRLCDDQKALLSHDFTARAVAAICQLPLATEVIFEDLSPHARLGTPLPITDFRNHPDTGPFELLAQSQFLLQQEPVLWDIAPLGRNRTFFHAFVATKLSALAAAGKWMRSVEIHVPETQSSAFARNSLGSPDPRYQESTEHDQVWSSLQHLEGFSVCAGGDLYNAKREGEQRMVALLAPFLRAPRLQKLEFQCLEGKQDAARRRHVAGRVLAKALAEAPSNTLRDITIQGVTVHASHLMTFLNHGLEHPLRKLDLSDIKLLTGTWVVMLDFLRRVQCPPKFLCLEGPLGAEIDYLSRRRRARVFQTDFLASEDYSGQFVAPGSLAEQYIRGAEGMANPISTLGLGSHIYKQIEEFDEEVRAEEAEDDREDSDSDSSDEEDSDGERSGGEYSDSEGN